MELHYVSVECETKRVLIRSIFAYAANNPLSYVESDGRRGFLWRISCSYRFNKKVDQ